MEDKEASLVTMTILLSSVIAIAAMCLIVVVADEPDDGELVQGESWYQHVIDNHSAGDRIYYRVGTSTYYIELISDDQVCW